MQDTVLVIYTVGYPPRLVPVSLVLPGLDVSPSSLFSSVPDMAPAPAPGAYAKAPAATPAMSAPAGGAQPPAAFVQLAGRPIAVNRTAQAPTASSQSKAIKVPNLLTKLTLMRFPCLVVFQNMQGFRGHFVQMTCHADMHVGEATGSAVHIHAAVDEEQSQKVQESGS